MAENRTTFSVASLRYIFLIVAVILFIIAAIGKMNGWWGAAFFAASFLV
jgi:hypothetical protein